MRFKTLIRKYFKRGSVCVTGQRGTGKDMIMANVAARRKEPYVSNIDYAADGSEFHQLNIQDLCMNGMTYKDLLEGKIRKFRYAYPEGADIYISDIGIYFPSQYCNELNKHFASVPMFLALSRQIANCNVHLNTQNLGRAWDKFREQSDIYIMCDRCIVLFNGRLVLQSIILYDRADSCQARVRPCRVRKGRGKEAKAQVEIYRDNFYNQHGKVERKWLLYRNRSKYDTRYFKKLLIEEDPI